MLMYRINKEDNIYIYGAGIIGQTLASKLRENGFLVAALIDRSKVDTSLPVINLEQYLGQAANIEDRVIITLNNGLSHDDLAKRIYRNGIQHILFLPMKINIPLIAKQKMRYAYSEIVNHNCLDVDIPLYQETDEKYGIIRDDYNEHISLLYPANELYAGTSKTKNEEYWKSDSGKIACKYMNKKAAEYGPYVSLFGCLENGKYDEIALEDYMIFQGRITDESRRAFFDDRLSLFKLYQESLYEDVSFFTDSPIQCYYKDKRVYIKDGYHRFFFLLFQRRKMIPIILKKEEYALLITNEKEVADL